MFPAKIDKDSLEDLWTRYENFLSLIRKLELSNLRLQTKIQNDTKRICAHNLEEKTKVSEYNSCIEKLKETNTIISFLSDSLDQIEEILDSETINKAQMEKLNELFGKVNLGEIDTPAQAQYIPISNQMPIEHEPQPVLTPF